MRTKNLGTLIFGGSLAATLITACSVDGQQAPRRMEVRKLTTSAGEITTLVPVGQPDRIEKVIGENELTPVLNDGANIPDKYRTIINAFGRMSMGCTATHIGNGLVLSAGHCFDAPPTRKDKPSCSDVKVEWGVRKDKAAYMTSTCVKILAYETNDDRDYAIYTVDKAPESKIDVDLSRRVQTDVTVTIFGHPQLRPLEWSKVCQVKPGQGNPGQSQDWGNDQFAHQCDTEPGNSGSTVLEDGSLKVIGIHDGGLSPWNYATYIYNTPLAEILGKPVPQPTVFPTSAPTVTPTAYPTYAPTAYPTYAPTAVPTLAPTAGPVPTAPPPTGQYPDLEFGPFGNDDNRTLAEFSGREGETVSFTIEADTEAFYDKVIVSSKSGWSGRSARVSGKSTRTFRDLRLPVTIRFFSDSDVPSDSVIIRDISVK